MVDVVALVVVDAKLLVLVAAIDRALLVVRRLPMMRKIWHLGQLIVIARRASFHSPVFVDRLVFELIARRAFHRSVVVVFELVVLASARNLCFTFLRFFVALRWRPEAQRRRLARTSAI